MLTLNKLNLFRILLIAQAIEISFLGSGRLLQFGPLTLRMYLFIIIIFLSFSIISKINKEVFLIISVTLFSFSISILIGFLNGNKLSLLFKDISPLLLIFELPFIFYTVNRYPKIITDISSVFKKTSLLMAIIFSFIILFILTGLVPFQSFYSWAFLTGEFFFRPLGNGLFGIGFFYKGFIYLGLGFFFYYFSQNKTKYSLISAFLATALALTLTRGLILSLILTIIAYYLFERKKKSLFIIPIIALFIYFSIDFYLSFLGNKDSSDSIRVHDMLYILNNTSFFTFFTGNGFGSLINNRVSVENSFLEILYIQGVIGIIPYLIIFYKSYFNYFKIKKQLRTVFSPFLYGIIFVAILSFTNPVINNPLGIFFMLIGYSVLSNNKTILN
jgi:hypothetical protein